MGFKFTHDGLSINENSELFAFNLVRLIEGIFGFNVQPVNRDRPGAAANLICI
jgi:hypothetical protein